MTPTFLLSLTATMALVPAALLPWRAAALTRSRPLQWLLLLVAMVGVGTLLAARLPAGDWSKSLSLALWLSVLATLLAFALTVLLRPKAWALQLLLFPYLIFFALLATFWQQVPARSGLGPAPPSWLQLHIVFSLATYAFATLAGIAAAAVFLQERNLKRRADSRVALLLPSLADGERLEFWLLAIAELVLLCGILTGMALEVVETGRLLVLDHKTLLALLAFGLIGAVLLLMRRGTLRGRLAARIVLIAYLLLTLAYPGVKFVTDVLLASAS